MAEDLKSMGYVVDVSKFTVGDILDLTDGEIPINRRLMVLQKGIVEGDLRMLPLNKLPEFIEAISTELGKQANPT
jgi:hypothetical protein